MATPQVIARRLQDRQIGSLETLRKLRRDRAEADVAAARDEASKRAAERVLAETSQARALANLQHWSANITRQADIERLRNSSGMSQAIFEFNDLNNRLRREEFTVFAAQRKESTALNRVDAAVAAAKTAAVSHEKIVECRKW